LVERHIKCNTSYYTVLLIWRTHTYVDVNIYIFDVCSKEGQ